jgi:hypothetical protein
VTDTSGSEPDTVHSTPTRTGLDRLDESDAEFGYIESVFTTALIESIPANIAEKRLSQDSELTDVIAVVEELEGTDKLQPLPDIDMLLQTQSFDSPDYDLTQSGTEQVSADTSLENTPLTEVPAELIDSTTPTEAVTELRERGVVDSDQSESPTSTESQPQPATESSPPTSSTESDPVWVSDEAVILDTDPAAAHMRCLECGASQFVHSREPVAEWTCSDCYTTTPPKVSDQLTRILTDHTSQSLPAIEQTPPTPNDTDTDLDPDPPAASDPHTQHEPDTAAAETTTQTAADNARDDDSEQTQSTDDFSLL